MELIRQLADQLHLKSSQLEIGIAQIVGLPQKRETLQHLLIIREHVLNKQTDTARAV